MRCRLRQFGTDQRANVVVTFALTLVPVMGSIGAAVDYSRANSDRAAMQAAADATALALAKTAGSLSSADLTLQATNMFNALLTRSEIQGVQVTVAYNAQGNLVTVSTAGSMKTAFVQVVGFDSVNISVRATATFYIGGFGCVLALDHNASGAALAQGSTVVDLSGCSLYDNSKSSTALTVGGSAKLSARSIGVAGDVSSNGGVTTTEGIATGISPVPDPYSNVSIPFYSGCDQNNFTTKATVTINPGVYCGGMQLNAGANVTLAPGIYYIDRGSLSVNGNATLTGDGVTLIFTSSTMSNWPTATINGGATINLKPPTSGPTAGIVMFGDRNMPVGTSFKFNGGASQYLGGAVYFPTGAVTFAGGQNAGASCTQLIADTVTFTGNSSLAIDCSSYGTKALGLVGARLVS